jgi:hypothetical protein
MGWHHGLDFNAKLSKMSDMECYANNPSTPTLHP